MRLAAIDVGTNTTRLLVAETTGDGFRDLERRLVFTRLGEAVDRTRTLRPEAIERTLETIADYCSVCGELGATRIRLATTSAIRDASNREEFLSPAGALAGVEAEILTGAQEGRLSFLGAVSDLVPGEYLVCDIGGGSTEFIWGSTEGGVENVASVDVGAVRLTERLIVTDPPEASHIDAVEAAIDAALQEVEGAIPGPESAGFVGVAGTVTSLAAIKLGLSRYDPQRTHHLTLSIGGVDRLYRLLAGMTVEERMQFPSLPEGRADVIVAGTAILYRAMLRWSYPAVVVSEKDILDGLIFDMINDLK